MKRSYISALIVAIFFNYNCLASLHNQGFIAMSPENHNLFALSKSQNSDNLPKNFLELMDCCVYSLSKGKNSLDIKKNLLIFIINNKGLKLTSHESALALNVLFFGQTRKGGLLNSLDESSIVFNAIPDENLLNFTCNNLSPQLTKQLLKVLKNNGADVCSPHLLKIKNFSSEQNNSLTEKLAGLISYKNENSSYMCHFSEISVDNFKNCGEDADPVGTLILNIINFNKSRNGIINFGDVAQELVNNRNKISFFRHLQKLCSRN